MSSSHPYPTQRHIESLLRQGGRAALAPDRLPIELLLPLAFEAENVLMDNGSPVWLATVAARYQRVIPQTEDAYHRMVLTYAKEILRAKSKVLSAFKE